MNNILTLDCTLRDGGYINNWNFGYKNIKKVITKLSNANIDIIECGFLSESIKYNKDISKFDTVQRVNDFLTEYDNSFIPAFMINFGEYNIDNIPHCSTDRKVALRVAFHKNDFKEALEYCSKIKQKGYRLFIQPMVSVSYSDEEFLELIHLTNEIKPYAFYIVDSFGVMKKSDLMRLCYLVNHNLNSDIRLGYHSHNNMQMAFSNAQELVELNINRTMIIDSCVLGMGRGAGNLNTELLIDYLNERYGSKYKSIPVLQLIDQVLNNMYLSSNWGYSLPHYLSAANNCHPNYATFLDGKKTLTVEDINDILSNLDNDRRNSFDQDYIDRVYTKYQSHKIDDRACRGILKKAFEGADVIVIAPGKSVGEESRILNDAISQSDAKVVSINFTPEVPRCDYVFFSNKKRFEQYENNNNENIIITSNIDNQTSNGYVVNYSSLLSPFNSVRDNSGLMLIRLLVDLNVKSLKIAGMDGYSKEPFADYANRYLSIDKPTSSVDETNLGIELSLNEYSKYIDIEFITQPKHYDVKNALAPKKKVVSGMANWYE